MDRSVLMAFQIKSFMKNKIVCLLRGVSGGLMFMLQSGATRSWSRHQKYERETSGDIS